MRRRDRLASLLVAALSCALVAVSLSGCATPGKAPAPAKEAAGPPPSAERLGPHNVPAQVPAEITVRGVPGEGASWKSRFVSASEMKRTLKGADGKETVKARTVGLELVAAQKVVSVAGGKARIEVTESSSRILQDGKYVDAPFKRLDPPNPVFFTLDLSTGKADFSEMEKAYGDWMASVKEGPAGEILGKTFRLDAYVAQLKELYAKPFTRFAGKTLSKEPRPGPAGEFVLPFLGPGVALGPVPVTTTSWYDGFEAKGGVHLLKGAGKYEGPVTWTADELKDRMADFGAAAPATFLPAGAARGQFSATVDILSAREIRAESQLAYSASAAFEGGTLSEEITGKSTLEPAD